MATFGRFVKNHIEGDIKKACIMSNNVFQRTDKFETILHIPIQPDITPKTTSEVLETYYTWEECLKGHEKHVKEYEFKVKYLRVQTELLYSLLHQATSEELLEMLVKLRASKGVKV